MKGRGRLFTYIAVALFLALAYPLELAYIRLEIPSLMGKLLFLSLLNLNVLALAALLVLVVRSFRQLHEERRGKVLGYRFKSRIFTLFVALISIPAMLLFFVAGSLGTNYIDRLFTPQFRQPVESSVEIAKKLYEIETERVLEYARAMATGNIKEEKSYIMDFYEKLPEDADGPLVEAFTGKEVTEVISGPMGDTVRAMVPTGGGVIVVDSLIPKALSTQAERVQAAYEDYVKLESLRIPLKLNYLLILTFFSLNIVLTTVWISMRIARGLTKPFQDLMIATKEVASGNLDVKVQTNATDERKIFTESFNSMVMELKHNKESLEKSYSESDRRRVCMENIVESIQSGVISFDSKGAVLTVNTPACEILGMSEIDMVGKFYTEILSGIDSPELEEFVKGLNLRTLKSAERTLTANLEGRKAVLRVSISTLRGADGEYMGLLVVFDDVTDALRAQKALAWQDVGRRIAHEIKNPLTPIRLSTERMIKKWEQNDPDFGQIFDRSTKSIIREVESLRRLVDEFSRLGKMPEMRKTPTDIHQLAEEVASLYTAYKDLDIKVDLPEGLPPVELDGEQFKRVMINVFDNAVQAMEGRGTIHMSVLWQSENGRMRLEIADDGPGVKEEDKEKLFLPYFSTKRDGTGLGLAIAQRIVYEHNGMISIRDNKPHGSIFSIEIPVKET